MPSLTALIVAALPVAALGSGYPNFPVVQHSTLSASSTYDEGCCPASHGYLDYDAGEAWCASMGTWDSSWLQVDLGASIEIDAAGTKGNSQWTEGAATFVIKTSVDGSSWTSLQEMPFSQLESDADTETVHLFTKVQARYVRFYPQTKYGDAACLRVEVYAATRADADAVVAASPYDTTCLPDDSYCDSEFFNDCCTSKDTSFESRDCRSGWKPIYTGASCGEDVNDFTCYPPGCSSYPDDDPYYSTNETAKTVVIIIIVVVVLGIVGGIVGGVFCCWCAKCCCFKKPAPPPARDSGVGMTAMPMATATATAVPVAQPPVAVATAMPVPV